ncbi:uncharacterized protein K02A2.6-like [Topomyia yanbarensis]|uniref:uncharacterized protein K02A2.6-like n=1 Tax=Topomyia yanbarensis TaxID=2498891 RepID=UPI00273CA4A9|nr:uncharacterized protein K02A2.6-like [Topomyia yanbarensis]
MEDQLLKLPPFECDNVAVSQLRQKWIDYKKQFQYVADAIGKKRKKKLKAIFLAISGRQLQRVYESLPGGQDEEDEDDFQSMINKLDEYFAPKRHDTFERHSFWSLRPNAEESLDKFLLRAKVQATKCQFGSSESESRDIAVVDKIVMLAPPELRHKILEKSNINLDDLTKLVSTHLSVQNQVRELNQSDSFSGRITSTNFTGNDATVYKISSTPGNRWLQAHNRNECEPTLENGTQRTPNTYKTHTRQKRPRINAIEEQITVGDNENRTPSFIFSISDNHDELVWFKVGQVMIEMLIDSGSKHNIIDESTWKYLQSNGAVVADVRPSNKQLTAYAQPGSLSILCEFESEINVVDEAKGSGVRASFFVIRGGKQNLLGRDTAKQLGVLLVGLPSVINPRATNHVRQTTALNAEKFPTIKGVKLRINIDDSVTPVAQHVRRVPIALRQQVEDKLNKLLRTGIIEKVDGPSPWVSPLVVVTKDDGELRLCVDMRRANTAIKREYHVIPTLDDLLARLSGARWFSRLDIKDAYHQVELHESSRHITTFITHLGMFRYTRLMFGVCSASEHFQRIIEQILSDCPYAFNYQDDIFVYGKTEQEHNKALRTVMRALEDHNVILNIRKCKFNATEMEFLGHNISQKGIKPTDDKIITVQQFRPPRSAEEVRSFLGLVGYVGRFIPDLATKTFELRQLMVANQKFEWLAKHEMAFNVLKEAVCTAPVLGFFDNRRRTRVIADASPVGLGAVLVQFEDDTDSKPVVISYASKALSPAERRYCQTEKEALAIVWSIEKFQLYLIGREFELETDHRPLATIFKPTSRPPGRIERWVLRLQAFRYRIVYKPGKDNIADPLSRLSTLNDYRDVDSSDDKMYVNAITESVAIDVSEIKEASDSDYELTLVKQALMKDDWNDENIKSGAKDYVPFQKDLSILEGYVIRGCRLVIPRKLRARMLQLSHEGHPGETSMVSRLRDRVWWPGIDKDAKNVVKNCEGCRLVGQSSAPEPMQRRKIPNEPWVDVAMDFLGPLPSGEYLLVIVDYYSRYKEVCIMKKITSDDTIKHIEPIFVRQGYPRTITLDNGRQFISTDFETYCHTKNITLNHTVPYWPQANGEVERQNRSLLKRLRISNALGRDWKTDLLQYLMMYNTTPHSTTGKTPTEMLRNKTIRSKIPSLGDIETAPPAETEVSDRDAVLKHRGKEREDLKRHAKPSELREGDTVLMQNLLPAGKLSTTFGRTEYVIAGKQGNRVTILNPTTGNTFERNSAHLKKVTPLGHTTSYNPDQVESFPPSPSQQSTNNTSCLNEPVNVRSEVVSRPSRQSQKPAWQNDYILDTQRTK